MQALCYGSKLRRGIERVPEKTPPQVKNSYTVEQVIFKLADWPLQVLKYVNKTLCIKDARVKHLKPDSCNIPLSAINGLLYQR